MWVTQGMDYALKVRELSSIAVRKEGSLDKVKWGREMTFVVNVLLGQKKLHFSRKGSCVGCNVRKKGFGGSRRFGCWMSEHPKDVPRLF